MFFLIQLLFYFKPVLELETRADLQPLRSTRHNSVETEIISKITHTVTAGLSAEDRYEKAVVLTHWLGGMLQPQHLTGPYLPWADCTAWYVSVTFVGKKDTAVRARWVKKTGQWHKLTSLRFLHDHDHLLVCVDSLLEKMLDTNTAMDAW